MSSLNTHFHWRRVARTQVPKNKAINNRCVKTTSLQRFLIILLNALLGASADLAAQDHIPITVVSKNNETREAASWEEPTLFPAEVEGSSAPLSAIRREKRASAADINPVIPPNGEADEISGLHSKSGFQTSNRIPETEPSALNFSASRERDAILARIQSDTSNQPYNIKIGRIPLRVAASLDLDFTDNAERTDQNQESELIILPRIDISGSVKLASKTTLSLGVGVGYIKYLNQTENDGILAVASLSPNTGVSLDFKIGKFLVSVYDRPGVPQFQSDIATQRNQSQYSQFSNTAGLSVIWNMNSKTDLSFRYNHTNLISLTSEENSTDGAEDSFLASLSWKLSESLGVGIQGGGEIRAYKNDLLNNGTSYHVGAYTSYDLSRYFRLQGSFGYQGGEYDSTGAIEDSSSLGTYYASLSVANNLNSHISHSLSLGREAQQGSFSNFTLTHYIKYQASWDILNSVNLSTWTSFEDIEESGGLFAQHFRYFAIGAYCAVSISSRISLALTYAFTKRVALNEANSQGSSLDFTENRVSLRLNYAF